MWLNKQFSLVNLKNIIKLKYGLLTHILGFVAVLFSKIVERKFWCTIGVWVEQITMSNSFLNVKL